MRYGTEVRARMFVQERDRQLMNSLLGLSGETGEILDYYKKTLFHPPHSRNPSRDDLRKEIGDMLWYLAALNEIEFGDSLLDVARENIVKLRSRWPERYNTVNIEELTL
jgi:NTP pyrophosphatase (non-canonical NTP hydrolase)